MKKSLRRYATMASIAVLATAVAGCASRQMAPNAAKIDVDFDWSKTARCTAESPEIRLRNVPVGTKTIAVKLVDFNAPSWNHGGGEVAYSGQAAIPAGALKSGYNGPCPPGGIHTYEFTVQAINEKGDLILGEGKKAVKVPLAVRTEAASAQPLVEAAILPPGNPAAATRQATDAAP